jgi:prepilin-type N-terminal cleavage/methylation domain-containing protein
MRLAVPAKGHSRGPWQASWNHGYRVANHHGFTLVEMLVVLAIFGVVMAALYTIFVSSNRLYLAQEEVVGAQQEARTALEIIGRQVRMAGYIAEQNQVGGTDAISAAAWGGDYRLGIEEARVDAGAKITALAFKADLDGDGKTDAVRYVYYHGDHATPSRRNTVTCEIKTWSGGTWTSDTGEQLFLENIQNLVLTYQLADGTTTETPATLEDIRGVNINLTARTDKAVEPYQGGKGYRTRQLISNIQIRNLGLS